jgi:hypothetical protein
LTLISWEFRTHSSVEEAAFRVDELVLALDTLRCTCGEFGSQPTDRVPVPSADANTPGTGVPLLPKVLLRSIE